MDKTVIDNLYDELSSVMKYLTGQKEISFKSIADDVFKKTFALSVASFFENEIKKVVIQLINSRSDSDYLVENFVKNKAIERQYHTFFNWKEKNANSFLGLFGERFKKSAKGDIEQNADLENAVKDFLELGNSRNELMHLNLAGITFEKTTEEVYEKYKNALKFIFYLEKKFKEYKDEEE